MTHVAEENERNRAKSPHELLMLNLILFHLLLTPLALALEIGHWALLLTPLLSLAVIAWVWRRARRAVREEPWFVAAHWLLALRRSRLLLIAYGVTGTILIAGWLVTLGVDKQATREILFVVFTRLAVMPTVIAVFVTFVLESSGLYQAARGEVPESIIRRFPPPGRDGSNAGSSGGEQCEAPIQ